MADQPATNPASQPVNATVFWGGLGDKTGRFGG